MNIFDDPIFPGTEFHDQLGGYDSNLWQELFIRADQVSPDLAQRLMYIRNVGCRLHQSVKFGYVIMPVEDYWEQAGAIYDEEKQCLVPYRHEIIRLLRGLKSLSNECIVARKSDKKLKPSWG